ncbi:MULTISPECIES: N-acetyltransferase [Microbacterium]|uniref:N-acetyltransferase n=1 Tax=Microbacterium aurugineum TaxID=2851642 RepID=A0ABY4IV97_9MICO|nr:MULTISPECIES: N-acetyltransferase [Microbacterium]QEA27407.1 N-acetyltransferase [Microbacterium sp. CBA3102]UPL16712.1 hypothetical protein KV397_02525 [Microbacterium aurugineum]
MNATFRARLFRRDDRDQLTDLVNAHLSAVIPGARVSVNAVLSSLERQPDEYVVDPWVVERTTIVVEQDDRLVAAAHLHRFADYPRVGHDYRGTGLVQWFLSLPQQDADERGADVLMQACLAQLRAWTVLAAYADGQLPFPGVYGIPATWPHVREALERGGFSPGGATESVLMATTAGLAPGVTSPVSPELTLVRELGSQGLRFVATQGSEKVGHVEVDLTVNRAERHSAGARLAELSDWEAADSEALGLLVSELREWLTLSDVDRVIAAIDSDDAEERATLTKLGFVEVTSTSRGWRRDRL